MPEKRMKRCEEGSTLKGKNLHLQKQILSFKELNPTEWDKMKMVIIFEKLHCSLLNNKFSHNLVARGYFGIEANCILALGGYSI